MRDSLAVRPPVPRLVRSSVLVSGIRSRELPFPGILPFGAISVAATECFVLPSRGEALSMALLEALAAGLPVLHTRECHFTELARAGRGLELEGSTLTVLFDGLELLVRREPADLKRMGQAGRAFAGERFTLEAVADQLLAMYRAYG